jgi:single-strand DNA-binding protein
MNKVMLIGNVGRDPEIKYYDQDQAIATFSLATTERGYTLANGIKVPDRTDWHNIVLWKGLAKVAEKYIHKGDKLYIEGRIRYRTYDDKKGIKHTVTEILGENMELLSPKPNTNETSSSESNVNIHDKINGQDKDGNSTDKLPF